MFLFVLLINLEHEIKNKETQNYIVSGLRKMLTFSKKKTVLSDGS